MPTASLTPSVLRSRSVVCSHNHIFLFFSVHVTSLIHNLIRLAQFNQVRSQYFVKQGKKRLSCILCFRFDEPKMFGGSEAWGKRSVIEVLRIYHIKNYTRYLFQSQPTVFGESEKTDGPGMDFSHFNFLFEPHFYFSGHRPR